MFLVIGAVALAQRDAKALLQPQVHSLAKPRRSRRRINLLGSVSNLVLTVGRHMATIKMRMSHEEGGELLLQLVWVSLAASMVFPA
jgi:hypothetical protein